MSLFDPSAHSVFRFVDRSLDAAGEVRLTYAIDDGYRFEERLQLPVPDGGIPDPLALEPLLDLLHWTAGVSYFKAAAPLEVACESGTPGPAAAALLEALYSEGLGEFSYRAGLPTLPRPAFPSAPVPERARPEASGGGPRVLVPIGGGKDSIVALEVVRRAGLQVELFSLRDAKPIARTVEVSGLPRLLVERQISPHLLELNGQGALNGHVPITAIVSCVAALVAAIHGFTHVTLANERSASEGNLVFDGVEINHQFSKGLRVERMLTAALEEARSPVLVCSLLRQASEIGIARAFSRLTEYHHAFSSCNRNFHLDPAKRGEAWCRDCDKCRFVWLALAPFLGPDALKDVFGGAMFCDDAQYEGFALLAASGGRKPFECVGSQDETLAALTLLAGDERWGAHHTVLARLLDEVLAPRGADPERVQRAFALGEDHAVPDVLLGSVRDVLGA